MKKIKKVTKKHKENKYKQAIETLNTIVMTKLAPSTIHGVGVFAIRDIDKGEKMYMDAIFHSFDIPYKEFNKLRPEIAEQILERWPNISVGSHFLYPDTRISAYLNHSEDPNYDNKEDKAIRDIKIGEEITEDYRNIEGKQVYKFLK